MSDQYTEVWTEIDGLRGPLATHELVCASIHFPYSHALSTRKEICHLRQYSQCLTAAALAPACFCCCFLFSCRISVMSESMGGKRAMQVPGVSVGRMYSDHSFIPIAGRMYAVKSALRHSRGCSGFWKKKKKINTELHSSFLYCWHCSDHKGELTEKKYLLCWLDPLLKAHIRAQWEWSHP